MHHGENLQGNQCMRMQIRNLARLSAEKKSAILEQARALRIAMPKGNY